MFQFKGLILLVVLLSSLAFADNLPEAFTETPLLFDLPGQDLASSLIEFAIQSKISVVVEQEKLRGHRSSPVVGTLTPELALLQLLSRSPFDYQYDSTAGSITIVQRPDYVADSTVDVLPTEPDVTLEEELVVTGIRASLLKALDLKYQATGIVDAIAEEDIGKFPDSNLAESLQRVSGVTISYSNNEGNKINVRGFDADFNLVLLNGRQMPTADIKNDVAAGSRSFNFADIASENIAAVEVLKTSRADRPTGGIGSVVNIKTARPFDYNETKIAFGGKGVVDTTNVTGDDITPEIFGLFSKRFLGDRIGVLMSGSYQERDSRSESASMRWFKNRSLIFPDGQLPDSLNTDAQIWYPEEINFALTDFERSRINAQAVFQFMPSEYLTATIDFTYSELAVESASAEVYARFSGILQDSDIAVMGDEDLTITQSTESGTIYFIRQTEANTQNINDSIGVNVDFQPFDSFNISLDAHLSTSELRPDGYGNSATIQFEVGNVSSASFDARFEIPELSFELVDQTNDAGDPVAFRNDVRPEDFVRNVGGNTSWSTMNSDLNQIQLDADWEISDRAFLRQLKLGVATTQMDNRSTSAEYSFIDPFAYGNENIDRYDRTGFTQRNTSGFLNQFSGGLQGIPYYFEFGIDEQTQAIAARLAGLNPDDFLSGGNPYRSISWDEFGARSGNPSENNRIQETTDSAYLQFKFGAELFSVSWELLTGVRYEKTKVETDSQFLPPTAVRWWFPEVFITEFAEERTTLSDRSEYDVTLPSLSLRMDLTNSLVSRFVYSETITRSDMDLMRAERRLTSPPERDFRSGFEGVPGLLPYSSKNTDVALEWYYGDTSYVSFGLYKKVVDDFPVQRTEEKSLFGLTDVYAGPRAEEARSTLIANGSDPTDENVFNYLVTNFPRADGGEGVIGDQDDPLLLFQVTSAVNSERVNIDGWEFAIQHLFGKSGFGGLFNFTRVESDAAFDIDVTGFETSFPSAGDFFNVVGFYDKHGLQIRLAYHWNEEFPLLTSSIAGVVPIYTEDYGQLDGLISYSWENNLTVFVEGINITDETQRRFNGARERLAGAEQFGPRYQFGFRYTF